MKTYEQKTVLIERETQNDEGNKQQTKEEQYCTAKQTHMCLGLTGAFLQIDTQQQK